MGKRIVLALGGNALGKNLPEQMEAVKKTASAIADLIRILTSKLTIFHAFLSHINPS